ncbi:zinc finger matrin-type protein 1 isoform X1 [Nerophis lumbriciformis]|uniref:zinc finger matrin-type protein 1 isoform X1 n=1 Tax=Nerophis lumbriciformis TaxID=546530 RepID=UPI003BAB6311
MEELNVCTPPNLESDAQSNIVSRTLAASATEPDKVINIKTDSAPFGGSVSDEELLQGLLTDQHCHVCEAVLLFEPQRLSHYKGKKHAQKLKLYLQTKKAGMANTESTGQQQNMPSDKERFCELCNMVFSSPVVAKSHYQGKVHTKNVRKHCLQKSDKNAEVSTLPSPHMDSANNIHMSGSGDGTDPTTASPDPNKYCVLCAATFKNHQMALQHYNGRKHQRKKARHELLEELGDEEANTLTCTMCSVQFNSVEMYQAHMHGDKHHIRMKKVFNLHKSQQKSYSTFADELSHYIEIQKARGLAPKIGQILPRAEPQMEGDQHHKVEDLHNEHMRPQNQPTSSCYSPYPGQPRYPGRPWDRSSPPSFPPSKASLEFAAAPLRRYRKCSGSSYTSSSSYSSSSSSAASDNHQSEHRQRERRRARRSERDRGRRSREANANKSRRKQRKRARDDASEERRREDCGESGEERRRKRRKRGQGKRPLEEDHVDPVESRNKTEDHVEQLTDRLEEEVKGKSRKEKKKTKDNRTEEEKLWDDSILGC